MTTKKLLLTWILIAPLRGFTWGHLPPPPPDGTPLVYYLDSFADRSTCEFASHLWNDGIWNGQQYYYLDKLGQPAQCLEERNDHAPNSVYHVSADSNGL